MKLNAKVLSQEQYLIPIKIVLVYLAWKVFNYYALIPGTALNHFWNTLVADLGNLYAIVSSFILTLVGLKASASGININLIDSNKQVWVQEHCLAMPAMIVFTCAVLLFRGIWREKLLFLAIGLAGIVFINLMRLILVSYAWIYFSPPFFRIVHSYVYVLITYAFIFLMLAWWMNRVIKKNNS